MTEREDHLRELRRLWPSLTRIQNIADEYGIKDVTRDNNLKTLQILLHMPQVTLFQKREGATGYDNRGRIYQFRSIDLTGTRMFGTNRTLTAERIKEYVRWTWVFGTFHKFELDSVIVVRPPGLRPLFLQWLKQRNGRTFLNNPKIPLHYVLQKGGVIYGQR